MHGAHAKPTIRPTLRICGLDVRAVGLSEAADAMVDYCLGQARRTASLPVYMTSINGHVLSLCARDSKVQQVFARADVIHCDGQPLVLLSHLIGDCPLPERVATTDLFPAVASRAARRGVSFYMLGGSSTVNGELCRIVRATYPNLVIVGARDGYLDDVSEAVVVAEIARLKPDILWVAMGVPLEQQFILRNLTALGGVGIIKTSGGLFDFLSGSVKRAPAGMQKSGFEWLYRLAQEPRRLLWRYAVTNPHALYLIVSGLLKNRNASPIRSPGPLR